MVLFPQPRPSSIFRYFAVSSAGTPVWRSMNLQSSPWAPIVMGTSSPYPSTTEAKKYKSVCARARYLVHVASPCRKLIGAITSGSIGAIIGNLGKGFAFNVEGGQVQIGLLAGR